MKANFIKDEFISTIDNYYRVGHKLAAVRYLRYNVFKTLREAKEFCDEYWNNKADSVGKDMYNAIINL